MTQANQPQAGLAAGAQGAYQQPFNPYTSNTAPAGLQGGLPYTQPNNYPNPILTGEQAGLGGAVPLQVPQMPTVNQPALIEQSYIENILSLNRGKIATVYMTFENNSQWNAKIFKGVVENAGRDHVVISDPTSGTRYLLPMINFDYATFDEELEYHPSFAANIPTGFPPQR